MIKRKLKHLLLQLSDKGRYIKKGISCKCEWYGNMYGGFYACPQILNESSIIYSFGIGEDISFDKDIIKKHNCNVYGFDPTPKSIKWLSTQSIPANFNFYDFGIGTKSENVNFFLPKNPNYVSGSMVLQNNINVNEKISVRMKSIEDIFHELRHAQIDVLKMDIEGSEYDVIDNILHSKIPVAQILIEFHDRFFENGKLMTQQAIMKLKSFGYEIFGVSDTFEEISFIRRDAL